MMFRRFLDEGLAQSSYLLACGHTRHAVVIDPRRDIDEYVSIAAAHGLTITHAIETHIHADFVSGARELAALGAAVVSGPGAALAYTGARDLEVRDNETIRVGDIELSFLHTPGHTPEHICILVRHHGQPARLFTGDTLFVGSVGRPDLLGESVARALANDLYDSLFNRLLTLPDDVEVHPGHGAGSLCGAGIGSEPHSTIGQERRHNLLLRHQSRAAFVDAVLGDLPETPTYFPRMKRVNRDGPPVLGLSQGVAPPAAVPPGDAARALAEGAWLLDLRPASAFGDGHPAGAISMTAGSKIGFWAGWLLPADARILLLADDERHAVDARRQLLRVGLDRVEGYVDGGFDAWRAAGLPVRQTPQLTPAEALAQLREGRQLTIVDVRSAREWQGGHVPGALHVPVQDLANRAPSLPQDTLLATVCEGGFRSSLAASLLERAGITTAANIVGGMSAWRALETASS